MLPRESFCTGNIIKNTDSTFVYDIVSHADKAANRHGLGDYKVVMLIYSGKVAAG